MRKIYFIASIPATAKDGVIVGVVANGSGRKATAEEVTALIELLRTKGATSTLLDSLRDATYPGPVSVFGLRRLARAEAQALNAAGGLFNWHVIELGESVRKPVRKVLGWELGWVNDDGTWARSEYNNSHGVSTAKGKLIATRKEARTVLSGAIIADKMRAVYADA